MAPGSTAFDRSNNVEQVAWDGIAPGEVSVTVAAHSITLERQSFALVIRAS
jgi:hypothetical protein